MNVLALGNTFNGSSLTFVVPMVTESNIRQHLKKGYGQGYLQDYMPWIKVNHFSSAGRSHRVLGLKTGRIHHFLSDLEVKLFNLLDFSDKVSDIREQYPLLDVGSPTIEITKGIALSLGIKHPCFCGMNTVLTTDFVVTTGQDNKIIARTVKPSESLDKRTLSKFEIEKNYWQKFGVEWAIVTDKELSNSILFDNLKNLKHSYRYVLDENIEFSLLVKVYEIFGDINLKYPQSNLSKCSLDIDSMLAFKEGTSLRIIKYLMAIKAITFDLSLPLHKRINISELKLKFKKDGLLHKPTLAP
jgi:hypothetical protein